MEKAIFEILGITRNSNAQIRKYKNLSNYLEMRDEIPDVLSNYLSQVMIDAYLKLVKEYDEKIMEKLK